MEIREIERIIQLFLNNWKFCREEAALIHFLFQIILTKTSFET